jgi:hemerythrin-like metal-binding protein
MTTIPWKEIYTVGVPEIDQQHQRLLGIINQLIEEQRDAFNREKFSAAVSLLTHYAYTHFATEERIMSEVKFPDIKDHVLDHVNFIMKMMGLALKVEQGDNADRQELLCYLRDWYAGHVLGIDRFYIPYVTTKNLPKHV